MFVVDVADRSMTPTDDKGEGEKNVDYATRVQLFMEVYDKTPADKYRAFDVKSQLGDCGTFPYGFVAQTGNPKPCIFLKFNKIWGWSPEAITDSEGNVKEPEEGAEKDEVPQHLLDHIEEQSDKEQVWMDCQGRYAADKQQLADGGLTYFPASRGIPIGGSPAYFPFSGNKESYHSPLVAIQVNPNNNDGQLIHVECRAYFKGVVHSTKDKAGLVQFEVHIIPEK
jgi:hypothetical protein